MSVSVPFGVFSGVRGGVEWSEFAVAVVPVQAADIPPPSSAQDADISREADLAPKKHPDGCLKRVQAVHPGSDDVRYHFFDWSKRQTHARGGRAYRFQGIRFALLPREGGEMEYVLLAPYV